MRQLHLKPIIDKLKIFTEFCCLDTMGFGKITLPGHFYGYISIRFLIWNDGVMEQWNNVVHPAVREYNGKEPKTTFHSNSLVCSMYWDLPGGAFFCISETQNCRWAVDYRLKEKDIYYTESFRN